MTDFGPRVGFAYAIDPKTAIRGGFGISYVALHPRRLRRHSGHQRSAGAVCRRSTQITPTTTNHCSTPLPAQIIAIGTTTPSCYATADQGFPSGLVTSFNPATDNITYIPKNTRDSYVESYFLSVQRQLGQEHACSTSPTSATTGVKLQGFLNANQKNPSQSASPGPSPTGLSDITEALNEFYSNYNSLQVQYEQRFVGGLTLLNSFTWEHSLDNASASLEGNTPSPQDGNNIRADYAQSDYNLPLANVTSLVYELPFGHGRQFLASTNGVVDAVAGRLADQRHQHRAGRHALQSHLQPQQRPGGLAADLGNLPRRQRVPPGHRARPDRHPGTSTPRRQHRLRQLHQLRRLRAAADQGRSRQCAEPVRQRQPQSRPHAGLLRDRPRRSTRGSTRRSRA